MFLKKLVGDSEMDSYSQKNEKLSSQENQCRNTNKKLKGKINELDAHDEKNEKR